MKKFILACTAVAFMAAQALSFARTAVAHPSAILFQYQEDKKEEVKINQIPNEITAALKGPDYIDWIPEKAWKMMTDEGWVYIVELKKGKATQEVKFTKEGKALKDKQS